MITRVWHGRTSIANADKYLTFLLTDGTRGYKVTPGNLSVKVWRRLEKDVCHFYTVTEWDSVDAIIRFAGADYTKAIYYPQDEGILLEFEPVVMHYECFIPNPGGAENVRI